MGCWAMIAKVFKVWQIHNFSHALLLLPVLQKLVHKIEKEVEFILNKLNLP